MDVIAMDDVSLSQGGFRLSSISAAVPKGSVTGIIGPNGSGKSTFIKAAARLTSIESGMIYIHDIPQKEMTAKEIAQEVAVLMQTRTAIPSMTVRELVALGRSPHRSIWKKSSTSDHEAIEWALEVTNSRINENRMLHTLSGGERQKAYIAMALAQKTETIILDEPTTYLDIAHQLELLELLKQLNQTHGITILMVLHDLQQAAKYCDRLIAMKRGQVHQIGSPKEVLTEDFFKEVFGIQAEVHLDGEHPLIIPIASIQQQKGDEPNMIIVNNQVRVEKGSADHLVKRFNKQGQVEFMEGFLGMEVWVTQQTTDYDEVTIHTRWNRKEDFVNWTKSQAFGDAHAHGKAKPEGLLKNKITYYEVQVTRPALQKKA
ncbi:heme oxygenase [Bacillus altitudinis]|uniref:heme oxygenase n=1 Tax=Bacillus altitudinis TaxID=293387 RepID=UPI002DDD0C84|nr:heme oxygenase [Bacillus altitudinis]